MTNIGRYQTFRQHNRSATIETIWPITPFPNITHYADSVIPVFIFEFHFVASSHTFIPFIRFIVKWLVLICLGTNKKFNYRFGAISIYRVFIFTRFLFTLLWYFACQSGYSGHLKKKKEVMKKYADRDDVGGGGGIQFRASEERNEQKPITSPSIGIYMI